MCRSWCCQLPVQVLLGTSGKDPEQICLRDHVKAKETENKTYESVGGKKSGKLSEGVFSVFSLTSALIGSEVNSTRARFLDRRNK